MTTITKPQQQMVVEVDIYPTSNINENTPKVQVVAVFERASLSEDMERAMEMGTLALLNAIRRVRKQGFKADPVDLNEGDLEPSDDDDN